MSSVDSSGWHWLCQCVPASSSESHRSSHWVYWLVVWVALAMPVYAGGWQRGQTLGGTGYASVRQAMPVRARQASSLKPVASRAAGTRNPAAHWPHHS